ncbi:hypothetical protein CAP35_02245 [Chitinophagaceae bacterium IBVUCB1]|nr:hypothetical protein CAP35_02245 [Chitinophagaceae bacterium IBVUCB1]
MYINKLLAVIICFIGLSANAQVIVNDMEQWRTTSVGIPPVALDVVNGWRCPDSIAHEFGFLIGNPKRQLYKSTDKVNGNYAARIVSEAQGSFGNSAGILTSAVINLDLVNQSYTLSGGTPIYGRVYFVNAWIKYNPQGGDTANITVSAIRKNAGAGGKDSVLGVGLSRITTPMPYTLIDVAITYGATTLDPDALQISFASSGRRATIGSELLIDDVSYSIFPASVNNVPKGAIAVYPNPANDVLYINGNDNMQRFTIYSIDGRQMMSAGITGKTTVNTSALAQGNYYYTITDNDGIIVQRNTITITR